jgi:hypothetical protein
MKLTFKKVTWVVVVVMISILGLTVAAMASDIVWPWSSQPGFEPQLLADIGGTSNRLDEGGSGIGEPAVQTGGGEASAAGEGIAGQAQVEGGELQPDDNGYTGAIIEASPADTAPSGDLPAEEVDWDALIPEGAPDQVDSNEDPNWSGFYYYHVTGSALHPRDSSVEWSTGGSGGCLYQVSGDPYVIYNLHEEIPNGARIDYLRIFYYDTSTSTSYAWVTRYDDIGGLEDLTYVGSEGTAGYGTALSPLVEHVVDDVNYSYILNWRPYVNGTSMYLCGLRVAYRLP